MIQNNIPANVFSSQYQGEVFANYAGDLQAENNLVKDPKTIGGPKKNKGSKFSRIVRLIIKSV